MSLDRAIVVLGEEVALFGQGTSAEPSDGSADWFVLRAKTLGLSYLKRIKQLEIERDAAATERFYRRSVSNIKLTEVPPPPPPPEPSV